MKKAITKLQDALPEYNLQCEYLLEKVPEELEILSPAQICGLYGFTHYTNLLQGVKFHFPVVHIPRNGRSYTADGKIKQDRKTFPVIIAKDIIFCFFFDNKPLSKKEEAELINKFKEFKEVRSMQEYGPIEFPLTTKYQNTKGSNIGYTKKKVYTFTGKEVNTWTERISPGRDITYHLYEKEDKSYVLFIEHNSYWEGEGGSGEVKIFTNIEDLASYDEAMACMAGYKIQI